jgi:adenylyltransferase/sulfurtransferase
MPSDAPITIDLSDIEEDRFSRFELITWWDQEKLRNARVLVVGAGALGNEILKNLALLGVGNIIVVDIDDIELSNLSRSVLFAPEDVGKAKAQVAADATRSIFRECNVLPLQANVVYEVGLGLFGWADVILGGLDNREARWAINMAAWKMNRPWIDGAIEGINGVARVFLPGEPPCYECTLGETDWEILEKRMSCNLLTRQEMETGKTPTTPTTSSVIAGIQVQEALKLLHGLPVLAGKGYVFEGMNHSSYVVEYTPNEDCMSHETYTDVRQWPGTSETTTLNGLLGYASQQLGTTDLVIEFSRDIIHKLKCPKCGTEEDIFAPVGSVTSETGKCPSDGEMREVVTVHNYSGRESFGDRCLAELGIPLFDVFTARSAESEFQILIEGDRQAVLNPNNSSGVE